MKTKSVKTIIVSSVALLACLIAIGCAQDEPYRRVVMSEKGTLKVTTIEHEPQAGDVERIDVFNSVTCDIELVDAGVPFDRAEIIVQEETGPVTLSFYEVEKGKPWIATYNPRKFGDILVEVIIYRSGIEQRRWSDSYNLEIGTWMLTAKAVDENMERHNLLTETGVFTSGTTTSGRHDITMLIEARIPHGQKLTFSLSAVMQTDLKTKFPGRTDVHFRLADYKDRYRRHTGYLEPNRILDDEPEKWIDGMTGKLELGEGVYYVYVAPSNVGQKTLIKAAYSAGEAHAVSGVVSSVIRPIDYSIFD